MGARSSGGRGAAEFPEYPRAIEKNIAGRHLGVADPDHIYGTRFRYDADSDEIESIVRLPAGYGKVAVVDEPRANAAIGQHRVIYVGDGSSGSGGRVALGQRQGPLFSRLMDLRCTSGDKIRTDNITLCATGLAEAAVR